MFFFDSYLNFLSNWKKKKMNSMKLLQVYWGGAPSLPTPDLGTVAMVEPGDNEPRTMKVEGKDFSFLFYVFFSFLFMLVTSRL